MLPHFFSTIIFLSLFFLLIKRRAINPIYTIISVLSILIVLYLVYSQDTKKKHNEYRVNKGREVAKDTRIIIATCLRNAEKAISNVACLYNKFNCIFKDVKLVVLENDSNDKTRKELLDLKKKSIPDMDIVGCGLDQDTCALKLNNIRTGWDKQRTRRMAKIRNIMLAHIKSIQKDYDYCLFFDGDLDIDEFEDEGIFDTMYYFDKDKTIDAIAANTYRDFGEVYNTIYDPFALKPVKGNRLSSLGYYFKNGLIKVKSAFNGFVFYRLPFSDEIKYNEDTTTCEHIEFNEQLKNMYINMNFVIEILAH